MTQLKCNLEGCPWHKTIDQGGVDSFQNMRVACARINQHSETLYGCTPINL